MTLVIIAGFLVGGGLWLIWSGWFPAREPLAAVLARLGRAPVEIGPELERSRDARLGAMARKITVIDRLILSMTADLRILRRSPDEQAAIIVAGITIGFVWAPVIGASVRLMGVALPAFVVGWGVLVGGAVGALVTITEVRTKAKERRRELTNALGAFCDVAGMALAAGRGVETALQTAANAGQGWAFAEFRTALDSAHHHGQTPWDALTELGRDTATDDLIGLSSLFVQGGLEGASVRETIRSKAKTFREREASTTEADAAATTERMSIPATFLVIGFLLFLSYPATAIFINL